MRFVSTHPKTLLPKERKSLHHKLGNGSRHKTMEVILVRSFISLDITAQRSIRRIVKRIKAHKVYDSGAYNATSPLSSMPGL